MNTYDQNTPSAAVAFRLTVLEGPDRGKKIDLAPNREYLMGRSEECDIRIDVSDKTVSRKHALLKITARRIDIENLSATNPALVNGKPIQKAAVTDKGQFRVGESLFIVEKTGPATSAGQGIPTLRIALIAALVLICGFFLFIFLSDTEKPTPADTVRPLPAPVPPPVRPGGLPGDDPAGMEIPTGGLRISAEDMKKADQHFRQGMFFYETGNLFKAVEEWNRAAILNPDHADARTWFLRAEQELEEKIKTHYQNAMLHYKYMRYNDAAHEFRLVVELSRDKTNDQYINALKLLNEIKNR